MYTLCNSNSNTPLVCLRKINMSLPTSFSIILSLVVMKDYALDILNILMNLNNFRILIDLIDLIIDVLNDIQVIILSNGIVDNKSNAKLLLIYRLDILYISFTTLPSVSSYVTKKFNTISIANITVMIISKVLLKSSLLFDPNTTSYGT